MYQIITQFSRTFPKQLTINRCGLLFPPVVRNFFFSENYRYGEHFVVHILQRFFYYLPEVESRTQGSRPRPRTQKNFEAKTKDRPSRGQGQGRKKISRPRPRTDPLEAKAKYQGHRRKCSPKKKGPQNFFQAISKKRSSKFFSGELYLRKPKKDSLQIFRKVSGVFQRNFNGSKIVLSSSRGQGNFRGLEASRPRT